MQASGYSSHTLSQSKIGISGDFGSASLLPIMHSDGYSEHIGSFIGRSAQNGLEGFAKQRSSITSFEGTICFLFSIDKGYAHDKQARLTNNNDILICILI